MNQNDDRRDREVDAEVDQRAADRDQRYVAEKERVDVHAAERHDDREVDEGEDQLVGPDLLRHRHRLEERIERPHEETVEPALADEFGHAADREEERVVEAVSEKPQPVHERRLAEVPAVDRRKVPQRYPERHDRGGVVDDRETRPTSGSWRDTPTS